MYRNSKVMLLAAGIAACFGAASAQALTVTLGNIHTGDEIENYFDGGTDSTGQSGPNIGIGFSSNAIAQLAGTSPSTGDGKFENNPSGQSEVLSFLFSNSTASYINDAAGFSALAFNYSFSNNSNGGTSEFAYLYSGLNGTGTLLDTLSLTPASSTTACKNAGDAYCTWVLASTAGTAFGTAESVRFGSTPTGTTTGTPVTITEFDGVTMTPAVPIPAALWLLISGLGSLFPLVRPRRA